MKSAEKWLLDLDFLNVFTFFIERPECSLPSSDSYPRLNVHATHKFTFFPKDLEKYFVNISNFAQICSSSVHGCNRTLGLSNKHVKYRCHRTHQTCGFHILTAHPYYHWFPPRGISSGIFTLSIRKLGGVRDRTVDTRLTCNTFDQVQSRSAGGRCVAAMCSSGNTWRRC